MRIDYCPKCKKAGLKYERYQHAPYANPPIMPSDFEMAENKYHHSTLGEKWCPRCREWVNPDNIPYHAVSSKN